MRRNKPWFGPIPSIGKAVIPVSWEGYVVTLAFVLGLGLLQLEVDRIRRSIAMALIIAAYAVVVFLTWEDPDAEGRRGWRETLWNRGTLVWLLVMLAFVAAYAVAGLNACWGCQGYRSAGLTLNPH